MNDNKLYQGFCYDDACSVLCVEQINAIDHCYRSPDFCFCICLSNSISAARLPPHVDAPQRRKGALYLCTWDYHDPAGLYSALVSDTLRYVHRLIW